MNQLHLLKLKRSDGISEAFNCYDALSFIMYREHLRSSEHLAMYLIEFAARSLLSNLYVLSRYRNESIKCGGILSSHILLYILNNSHASVAFGHTS